MEVLVVKKILKVVGGVIVLSAVALYALVVFYPRVEAGYQEAADVYRLKHLQYYGGLIEEYHVKTGEYPFEGESELPIYAFVAHDRQVAGTEGGIPYEHERRTMAEFVSELEKGLGREIDEFYDPQYVATVRPNFYMYVFHEDRYFFAVHLQERFSFSQPVGPGYNKIEISNLPEGTNYAVSPTDLWDSPEFIEAVNRVVENPGSMDAREAEYRHFTKRSGG
jgi:hypothetical protein